MSHVVDVVLAKEVNRENPGAGHDNLVHPLAVAKNIRPLLLVHDNLAFLLDGLFVAANTHNQIRMREELLGLLQHPGVTDVIHIEDAVGIDPHRVVGVGTVRLYKKFN